MSTYYDVQDVKARGQYISSNKDLRRNCLVAVCDRGVYELAVDVSVPDEYDYFHRQYTSGLFLSMTLYDYAPPDPAPERQS